MNLTDDHWPSHMSPWQEKTNAMTGIDTSVIFSDDEYGLLNAAKLVAFQLTSNGSNNSLSGTNFSSPLEILSYEASVVAQSPSSYPLYSIIILAIIMTAMMILIVIGNMLVVISIATENNLATVQNWFIASLAVADMLIGLVIMPFSLSYELMGYWMFGTLWCEIHGAMDVLLCTASIMNLCLISLDRYWSITRAVDYLTARTPKMVGSLLVIVWLLSGFISIPPLLGWKQDVDNTWFVELLSQQGNRSQMEFLRDLEISGIMDLTNFTNTLETLVYPQCRVSSNYFLPYKRKCGKRLEIVFDTQALLKNQKMALLVVLRGAFLGGIGTLLFNEFWHFLKMKVSFLLY